MIQAPPFTKRKFLNLPPAQRHKKGAELLRKYYERMHRGELLNAEEIAYYEMLATWSKWTPFSLNSDLKQLSDRYHWHLKEAGYALKEHNLLPALRTGDHIPKASFPEGIAIYLDRVRSAYNVGSILRTVEALRIGSVHFSEKTPFIDNEKVMRTAMGAAEIVPCFSGTELSSLPRPIIALDTSDQAVPLSDFLFPKSFTLILGNEEYGISDASLKLADYLVEIPLLGAKNSLNVACAFAIAAEQIRRQLHA